MFVNLFLGYLGSSWGFTFSINSVSLIVSRLLLLLEWRKELACLFPQQGKCAVHKKEGSQGTSYVDSNGSIGPCGASQGKEGTWNRGKGHERTAYVDAALQIWV